MKHLTLLSQAAICGVILTLTLPAKAQLTGFTAELDTMLWETEAGDPLEDYAYYGSYKVYANFTNSSDVLSAVFASNDVLLLTPPMGIDASCGCLNPAATSIAIDGSNQPLLFPAFPEYEFDSFWTIGMETADDPGQLPSIIGLGEASTLCAGMTIEDGAMFTYGSGESTPVNAIAGEDLKILIARVTTCGDFTLQACTQVFVGGDQDSVHVFCPEPLLVLHQGCTEDGACNYNPLATTDDGSCVFEDGVYGCDGECINDEDGDGICDDVDDCVGAYDDCGECNGDNSSCTGCADSAACNYEGATIDDGSCLYLDALGVCGGDCTADLDMDGICDDVDYCVGAYDDCGVCNSDNSSCTGCADSAACNYEGATIDDGSCLYLDALGVCGGDCTADLDMDGICDDVDDCVGALDVCGICNGPGAINECGCIDIPDGDCDCNGNQLDAFGVCGGDCLYDNDDNGICDDQEVYGCGYELAENFNPEVTRDDGSCVFPCEGVVNTNVFDWDGDYVVTVTDFLMMLSVYGDTDLDLDGVWDSGDDCVDINACNYASDPSEPCAFIDVLGICGGGCDADEDADGICDDVDSCIGVEDECGVCNGPGPTEVVIDDIFITYDSVFLPLDNDWFVFPVSADTTFTYTCAPFFGDCGDPVSYQGYDYATVLIGEQCWFAENLRSENYENGDAIPAGLSDSEWSSTTSGATAVYGESASNLETYGRLYNWYAVDDPRGLCPSGWHVPTDGEWMTMEMALGMSESEANGIGYRGTDQGSQMKTTYGWSSGGNGTNSSGFSGLPGGYRFSSSGSFINAGFFGIWWSSTPNGSSPWGRHLDSGSVNVYRTNFNPRLGFSVRCVRDAE